ncbi:MAG TPA: hypothetical protein VGQ09_06510 [Chitinophagaceae bacterium]|jgi:hypothetical protein|nr:hypothetical protein [Chitinophagaceae bacterium]
MLYRARTWKQFAVFLLLFLTIFACKKQHPIEPTKTPGSETPPSSTVYESLLTFPSISYCGSPLTSYLKIKDGTNIGTVTVGNDDDYLYLTYDLSDDWYMGDAHCYAGKEFLIPRNSDNGNPNHEQFPGKQDFNFCDLRQTFTFRVLLSSINSDIGQCSTNTQYYIAMRASVKQISSADCDAGTNQPAWGAPFLINPGNTNEWATAFYYCKQECTTTIPTTPWCAYSQGYWFNNPDITWCGNVKFGTLDVAEQDGVVLWPAKDNWLKRAFFQASALQLSMSCANNGNPIPTSIATDYNSLETFLSKLSYADIQNRIVPAGTDTTAIQTATGNIGKWICQNHCNSTIDSTACSGY